MIQLDDMLIQADTLDVLNVVKAELAERGIQRFNTVRENGSNIQTNCPFHKGGQERKPSFGINGEKNKCHCFTCNWAGSIDEFVSEVFGYNDNGAYGKRWLVRRFNSTEIEHRNINLNFERRNQREIKHVEYVSEEELDSYRFYHPYWAKRGITDEAIIELFDLGYDADTDCITMPNRDINGNCLFVARRSVNTKFFNYPKDVEKPLYGLYELYATKDIGPAKLHILPSFPAELYVCESMIDALTIWQYGRYAVALNGLGNDLQMKQLSELPCRKLILATDGDERGMNARDRLRKHIKGKIITEVALPPGKKDINELTREEFYNLHEYF